MLAQILQSTQTRTETYCLIRQTNPVPALPVSTSGKKENNQGKQGPSSGTVGATKQKNRVSTNEK